MKNKAEMTTKEILELVLAAAGIFLLIFLLIKIISPDFDKGQEASISYLSTMKSQLTIAEKEQVGIFSIWENELVYLVYFGDTPKRQIPGPVLFIAPGNYKNQLCFCYVKEEGDNVGICSSKACTSINYPLEVVKASDNSKKFWMHKNDGQGTVRLNNNLFNITIA